MRCPSCAKPVEGGARFCSNCGASLDERRAPKSPASSPGTSGATSGKLKLEPWHYVAGVIVLGLVVYLTVLEVQRPAPTTKNPQVHENIPEHSSALLKEIERLQQVTESNPDDGPSMLRLANLLHDNAMADPRLFVRAADAYRKYLALNPKDGDARVDLGICYFELARLDSLHGIGVHRPAETSVSRLQPRDCVSPCGRHGILHEVVQDRHGDQRAIGTRSAGETSARPAFIPTNGQLINQEGGRMPSGKKRKRHKMATHKRKKRLRKMRHKKKLR
jgi:hypothetical protein